MRDDSAETLIQSSLLEALGRSSGSSVTTLHGEASRRVTFPIHASFRLLTAARIGSRVPEDLAQRLVVSLVFQVEDAEKFPPALVFTNLDPFFSESENRTHVSSHRRKHTPSM